MLKNSQVGGRGEEPQEESGGAAGHHRGAWPGHHQGRAGAVLSTRLAAQGVPRRATKAAGELSWYRGERATSLRLLIERTLRSSVGYGVS